jgi:hypothetical protein
MTQEAFIASFNFLQKEYTEKFAGEKDEEDLWWEIGLLAWDEQDVYMVDRYLAFARKDRYAIYVTLSSEAGRPHVQSDAWCCGVGCSECLIRDK